MNATEWEIAQIGDEVVLKDSSENKPVNPLTTDRQVLFLDGETVKGENGLIEMKR